MTYPYKTEPRGKQREVIEDHWHEPVWALLCRPGTGKTKIGLDHAAQNWLADRIDALIVIAPDGVDRQWIEEGVPTHLPDVVPRVCRNYRSRMSKRAYQQLENLPLLKPHRYLIVLTISFDGLETPRGRAIVQKLQETHRTMVIDDESHRTSNPKSQVYKAVKPVMRRGRVRRIATGTLIRQNPYSAFGQFELMGDALLGFSSLASFKAMYTKLMPLNHPLVKNLGIKLGQRRNLRNPDGSPKQVPISLPFKDEFDRPMYRNLADLRRRLAQFSSFLTLADVNGKEPIVNETPRYVQLSDAQRVMYDDLVKYGVAQAPGGQLTAEGALALSIRLAQVTGGFSPSDDDPNALPVGDVNPKLREVLALVDELGDEKVVIWCKFTAELITVTAMLQELYGEDAVAEYHGRMNSKTKDANKRTFIDSERCRFFCGQQKAGGTGLDGLQGVAHYMIFYSNDYPYLERLQAISRLARTNGADTVQVWDIIAEQTVDEDIVKTLKSAQDVDATVMARAIVREWE